jgi:hypothetical protein
MGSTTQSNDPGYGMRNVDISFGGADLMGLSKASTAGLIILGPIGLIAILTGLVKTSEGSGAPPPAPGTPEAAAEEGAPDDGSADPGAEDPGAGDPGAGDPGDGSADPGAYADDGSSDSSGTSPSLWLARRRAKRGSRRSSDSSGDSPSLPKYLSIEQLNKLSSQKRALAQKLIRTGRIRLA